MTATTQDQPDVDIDEDDGPRTVDDIDDAEDFDNPDLDGDGGDGPAPVDRRSRTTRAASALAVLIVVGLVAARWFGIGPFGNDKPETMTGAAAAINVVLPNEVIEAIKLAQQPGKLTTFENRPSAQDPKLCQQLPPFTNEALYGLAAGDGQALCERVIESGAAYCSLFIGVATSDKGAIFYLSSSGVPLPGQISVPTKVFWCPDGKPPATTIPTSTTVAAQPGGQ